MLWIQCINNWLFFYVIGIDGGLREDVSLGEGIASRQDPIESQTIEKNSDMMVYKEGENLSWRKIHVLIPSNARIVSGMV